MEKVIKKPWGYEVTIERNEFYVIKKLVVSKGHRLSLQYHDVKHETLVVDSGQGRIKVAGEVIPAMEGVITVIPPKTVHRIEAHPDHDLVIMEVSTPQLDDVVRIEDDYERGSAV